MNARFLVPVPFVAVFAVIAVSYLPFLSDDSLISLRYADRLLDGFGLTWTDGRPVEGYSNLLWVLVVAAVGWFGVDLIDAARGLGIAFTIVAMAALAWRHLRERDLRTTWPGAVFGLTFLALSAPLAVWAVGGLEQPLLAGLLAIALAIGLDEIDRPLVRPLRLQLMSLALGLACLTRPDAPIFAAATAMAFLVAPGPFRVASRIRRAALVLAWPVALSLGQLMFRLWYYGEWVPNTALVKISGSATHRTFGWEYVSSGFWAMLPFSALALIALVFLLVRRTTRRQGILLAASAVAWCAYVVFIGGDIFPAYRHLTPAIVVSAFAIAEAAKYAGRRTPALVSALLVMVLAIPYWRQQANDKWINRAKTERWEWQAREVALLLKAAFRREQPRIAVTAAGSLPYWSELPALDMMGLSDYYLPRHRPADFGKGMVGHELGDGQYVLDQKPDLIIFDVGSPQPSWRTGDQLLKLPEFTRRYVPVAVRTAPSGHDAVLYVDTTSSRIGVQRSGQRISIPGLFFATPSAPATLDSTGRLIVSLSPGQEVRFTLDVESPGSWKIDQAASGLSEADAQVRQQGSSLTVTVRPTAAANVARVVLVPAG